MIKRNLLLIIISGLLIISAGYTALVMVPKETNSKLTVITEPKFNKKPNSINNPPSSSSLENSPKSKIWIPSPKTSWQWQLSTPIDKSVNVQMYDIDMFNNDASTVKMLHDKGRHVVCYISAGSVEDWRPDAKQFPSSVVGKDYEGWPGEKWLDIRRLDIIGPIMEKRLDQCREKDFDSVEPDNINGYSQDTGFDITQQDQITYNIWLANAAHKRNLSIGLKQDPDQANELVKYFDWALDEECFEFGGCEKMKAFTDAGKAVFNTEYNLNKSQFCLEANRLNFNSIKKHKELDAYLETCR
ncbi:MAG: endo alpha-1,4 polygalactosaminidase [Candidatus Saccharimonadales bacterium]